MKIFLLDTSKQGDNFIDRIEELPAWRKAKATKLTNEEAKKTSVAAGLLFNYALRELVKEYESRPEGELGNFSEEARLEDKLGNFPEEEVQELAKAVVIEEKGKPDFDQEKVAEVFSIHEGQRVKDDLSNQKSELHFSLSHSGNYIALVLDDEPVGIDIETKGDKEFRVTRRMFTEEEASYVVDGATEDKQVVSISEYASDGQDELKSKNLVKLDGQDRFRNLWSKKEAYLKLTGIGISVKLNSFTFDWESGNVLVSDNQEQDINLHQDINHDQDLNLNHDIKQDQDLNLNQDIKQDQDLNLKQDIKQNSEKEIKKDSKKTTPTSIFVKSANAHEIYALSIASKKLNFSIDIREVYHI